MRKGWLMGGVTLVLALVAGGGWMWSRSAAANAAKTEEKTVEKALEFTSREAFAPQRLALASVVSFSGPLVAPNTATLRSRAAGTLLSLSVAEGSRVQAGQTLGTLDLAELNARLAERQAQVASARAQLTQAERSHASNQKLADDQFISPNALESSRAAQDTARAALAAAQAQADTVRITLRDAALVAPISGIVSKRHVLPGEKVAPEQSLLTIVDLKQLEMAGSVGTNEVSRLQPGMPVSLTVEGLPQPLQARLARIAPAAEAGTRAIGVTVAVANPDEALRAGQYAVAQVSLPQGEPRLTMPIAGIVSASGQDYAWTVEQGKLVRRTVTLGQRDPVRGLVEVVSGLKPEVPVLAMRFENLREGAPAKLVNTPTGASAPVPTMASAKASAAASR